MEHIVHFSVNIDDNAITEHVTQKAEKEIIKDLKQQVVNRIFHSNYYRMDANPNSNPFSDWAEDKIVKTFIEENKDRIIQKAAEEIAARLARTKVIKEILKDVT